MGGVMSLFKEPEPRSVQPAGSVPDDPRSPTTGIARTPIAVDKRKPYLETDIDNVTPTLPLRVKLLRKIADPRSPTIGINRTPIALSGPESPVSLYSNYQTELGSETCLSPACEPSMNVSDFESEFARELDSLVDQLDKSLSDSPVVDEPEVAKPVLSLKDDSAKKLCEDLVAEIIESFKEYEEEVKNTKPVTPKKKLKLVVAPNAVSQPIVKKRKPLSNITSSAGNTPTKKFQSLRKEEKLVKVKKSGENSPVVMSSRKVRAQWDHDTTVVI